MPKTNNRPSKEELQAQIDEAVAVADELEGLQSLPADDKEAPEPVEEVNEPEEEEVEAEEEPQEEEEAEPSKELYKKKFSESSKESQKLYAKNRVMNKAIADAEDVPEPTEEELEKEFSDWDVMSDTEKTFAKETIISRNWRETISKAKDQASKIEKWSESVDDFVGDPKTYIDAPELEGKQSEFAEFAKQEENNNVPMHILKSAFLHENSSGKQPNKGRMFEKGSGGPNDKPTPRTDKITIEEASKLRQTDYNKYKEYLVAGKIETDL